MPGPGRRFQPQLVRFFRAGVAFLPLAFALLGLPGCSVSGVRPGAKSVLEILAPPPAELGARWAINPYNADERYKGTLILANAPFGGEPVYLELFEDNADDQEPTVRAAATRALGSHGGPDQAPILIKNLADKDPGVRLEAARALQRIHAPQAVPALFTALDPKKEDRPAVRLEAATALGQYRDNRVVERLIAALSDDQLAVNVRVAESLRTLTGQDLGTLPGPWQAWYKSGGSEGDLFAAGSGYTYRGFDREKFLLEYIPIFPQPLLEKPGIPAGLSPASTARPAIPDEPADDGSVIVGPPAPWAEDTPAANR